MLTRDLLMHRTTKGRIKPGFLDLKNKSLISLANDLVDIFEKSELTTRELIEETVNERIATTRRTKVAKGLVKLLFDRSVFQEPSPDAMQERFELFGKAVDVFRGLEEVATIDSYRQALSTQSNKPIEELEDQLYSDLAPRRPLEKFKSLTGKQLLQRYNLAQVQGLLVYAQELELQVKEPELLAVRKMLRWLRFCRLVAEVRREGKVWRLRVDGPGAILSMQKKYGLQLAQFMLGVPLLDRFQLEAIVQLPRKNKSSLIVTEDDGLVSPQASSPRGHIPEEIAKTAAAFEQGAWELDLLPEPCYIGKSEMCVPDFRFRHREKEIDISMELFHRWHKAPLMRRIQALGQYPEPNFVLGVDKALVSNPEIQAQVENNEQIFVFNAFPSLSKIKKALKRYE